jgi:hypothetical protein
MFKMKIKREGLHAMGQWTHGAWKQIPSREQVGRADGRWLATDRRWIKSMWVLVGC